MISGYIFKRGRSSEMPRVLEVNVIWTEMNPRILEAFLREILSWYVGLNTLACARGVLGREEEAGDPRPLGVVVVERAVRALHVLM